MISANNPDLVSWINVSEDSDFPIQNIPFGVGFLVQDEPFVATRIGDKVINLAALNDKGYFKELGFHSSDFNSSSLNALMKYGKLPLRNLRNRISSLFAQGNMELQGHEEDCMEVLYSADRVQLLLPVSIGDYTDFYSSKEHATNVGTMFRDPANALLDIMEGPVPSLPQRFPWYDQKVKQRWKVKTQPSRLLLALILN
jgi:fumarylacetoacetase